MPVTDSQPPGPGETIIRRTTSRFSSKIPWLPLILAALIVPLLLTALATITGIGERDKIQKDLSARSVAALEAQGISGAAVSFDGRDGTVSGIGADQEQLAKDTVLGVDGVRVASIDGAGGGAGDDAGSPLTIDATADKITLSGEVADDATKKAMVAAAEKKAGGREVVDELTVKKGAKSSLDAAGVGALTDAAAAAGGDIKVDADGKTVTLSGKVPSEEAKAEAEKKAQAAAPGSTVDNQLTIDEEKAALQKKLKETIEAEGISFSPNSAKLTSGSMKTLKKIASALKESPDTKIEVQGHVADVAGVKPDAQTLSDRRAEAVKKELVALGVAADRVAAKGYGGTEPVAPNKTSEGQAANRRVEIVVL